MDNRIQVIQEELNSGTCIFCGKAHHVELDGKNGVVTPKFSEDTCQKFIEKVNAIVSIRCASLP